MITLNCPKCKNVVSINIANAIDEHGEVFMCPNCRYKFRYTLK